MRRSGAGERAAGGGAIVAVDSARPTTMASAVPSWPTQRNVSTALSVKKESKATTSSELPRAPSSPRRHVTVKRSFQLYPSGQSHITHSRMPVAGGESRGTRP